MGGELIRLSDGTKLALEGIKKEQGYDSLDDAVRFLENVYVAAKEAGVLTITGGFPVFRKSQ